MSVASRFGEAPVAAEPALTLDGVTKRFGGLAVTQDIRFAVPVGTRTALIGPTGAGKTTLFNLISGVYKIDAGRILLDGRPIQDLPPRKRVQASGLSRERTSEACVCWPSMMFSITERCGIKRMFWKERERPAWTRLRGGRS